MGMNGVLYLCRYENVGARGGGFFFEDEAHIHDMHIAPQ